MNELIAGALAMGYCTVAVFFLRYWTRTRDRLFAIFSGAFFILGCVRIALIVAADTVEHQSYLYWFRFAAYLLILIAIVDKNRR